MELSTNDVMPARVQFLPDLIRRVEVGKLRGDNIRCFVFTDSRWSMIRDELIATSTSVATSMPLDGDDYNDGRVGMLLGYPVYIADSFGAVGVW